MVKGPLSDAAEEMLHAPAEPRGFDRVGNRHRVRWSMPDTLNKNAQPVLSFRLAISAQSQGARRFPARKVTLSFELALLGD